MMYMKKILAHTLMKIALVLDKWAWRLLMKRKWGKPLKYKYKITALNAKGEVVGRPSPL